MFANCSVLGCWRKRRVPAYAVLAFLVLVLGLPSAALADPTTVTQHFILEVTNPCTQELLIVEGEQRYDLNTSQSCSPSTRQYFSSGDPCEYPGADHRHKRFVSWRRVSGAAHIAAKLEHIG
jgi:hypothetical protein